MQLHVTTPTGMTITVAVNASNAIGNVKGYINANEGIPPTHQRLRLFDGHPLERGRRLSYFTIEKDTFHHLALGAWEPG